jgi:hypothetical protein
LILGEDGAPCGLAKIASDAAGRTALGREVEALKTLGPLLPPPLGAPRILDYDDGVLLLEAASWRPRARPWILPIEAARALGIFFAAGRPKDGGGPAHGDFAPWNLLQTDRGWIVVDWEHARSEAPPYYDVFHYLVQSCGLLGHPSPDAILEALTRNQGAIAALLRAYAEGAGIPPGNPSSCFLEYLDLSRQGIDPDAPGGRASLRVRDELQRRVGTGL